jgi:hypothetical protein
VPRVLTFSELEEEEEFPATRRGHLTGGLAGMEATLAQQTASRQARAPAQLERQRQRRAEQRQQERIHVTLSFLKGGRPWLTIGSCMA